jgi:hypothetical protein
LFEWISEGGGDGEDGGAVTAEDGGGTGGHRCLTDRWFRAGGGHGSEESMLGFPGAVAVRSSDEVSNCRSLGGRR